MESYATSAGASSSSSPITTPLSGADLQRAPDTANLSGLDRDRAGAKAQPLRWWEPFAVFWLTFLVLMLFVPRMLDYLSPKTGDEPFYLMTAISLLKDGDLNECNNYRQRDEAQLYPAFMVEDASVPRGFKGFAGAPYPLPPHPAQLVPATRMCGRSVLGVEPEPGGAHDELYSKHGLGLTLLILPAFALGGVPFVTYFLVLMGALLATNI